jgi:HPt (histidine-containing phosphotransfer) domain-containing protein
VATLVDPNFRARLAALGDKYAAGIPATLQAITAALSHCRNADADAASLEKLHALLHGVAGSAATFGYAGFGAEARRLEQELLPLLGKRPAELAGWDALAAQVERYLAWAAQDPKGPVSGA